MDYCDTNLNPIEGYAPGASSTLFFHIAGFFMNQRRFVTIDEPRTTVTGKGLAMIPNVTWVQHGPSQTSFDSFLTLLTQTQRAWWREALWCHQKVPFRSAYWPPFPGWNTVMLDHWLGLHFWAIFLVVRGLCSMRQAARGGTSAIFLRRVLYARYAVCLRETLPGPCEEEHFHMFGAFFDGHIFMASPWWSPTSCRKQFDHASLAWRLARLSRDGRGSEWKIHKNTVSNQNSWNTYAQLPRSKIVKMDPGFAYVNCLCQGFLGKLAESQLLIWTWWRCWPFAAFWPCWCMQTCFRKFHFSSGLLLPPSHSRTPAFPPFRPLPPLWSRDPSRPNQQHKEVSRKQSN